MSDIDVDRLKWDADYWDEYGAPENATHVGNRWDKQPERGFKPCWYRLGDGAYFYYPENRQWEPCANGEPSHIPTIPRPPKKAQEGEWDGEGLPPVGTVCKGYPDERSGFERCLVVWHDPEPEIDDHPTLALFEDGGKYCEPLWCTEFRPLKPKHERQREELMVLVSEEWQRGGFTKVTDAVIKFYEENYNLEPKP